MFINMPENAKNENISYLTLKEELFKLKDKGTNKLSMAILKRKQVQGQLALILKSVKAAEEEIVQLQDANNLHLTEMVSILERKSISETEPLHQQGDGKIEFLKLVDLVDDASPTDTAEALKLKMIKTVERYEQMLREATAIHKDYDFRLKTKIRAILYDKNDQQIPTCNELENGFRINAESPVLRKEAVLRQDLMLISFAIFSFLQRQNANLKNVQHQPKKHETTSSVPNSTRSKSSSLQTTNVSHMASRPSGKFVLGQSIFVLRLFKSGTPKGEIHIRPEPTFDSLFLQQLGDFCYNSQKHFSQTIEKVTYCAINNLQTRFE